jgi:hypothetical protein
MRHVALFVLLVSASLLLGQNTPGSSSDKHDHNLTIQGCVSRSSGDYVLMKQDPAVTYELQATGKIKLHEYLGQRVEVTGKQSPSMSTSSDSLAKMGSAAPVTLTITSIKTIDKECPEHQIPAR